MLLLERAG